MIMCSGRGRVSSVGSHFQTVMYVCVCYKNKHSSSSNDSSSNWPSNC